jgi:hypothetical protein
LYPSTEVVGGLTRQPGCAAFRSRTSTGDPPRDRRNSEEGVVLVRPRTILAVLGIVLGVVAALRFVLLAQTALTLITIALFLTAALNPAVELFEHGGLGSEHRETLGRDTCGRLRRRPARSCFARKAVLLKAVSNQVGME